MGYTKQNRFPLVFGRLLLHDAGNCHKVEVCALCCLKHTTTLCGECNGNYGTKCFDPHIIGAKTVHWAKHMSHLLCKGI